MPRKKTSKPKKTTTKEFNLFSRQNLIKIVIMILIYVLLGEKFFKPNVPNPMVPGAVVAVNMIIIVLAGILFGKEVGLTVGFIGTLINAVLTGSGFEYAAIIPHGIMGYLAGWLRQKNNIVVSSLSIVVGHLLNILMFILMTLLPLTLIYGSEFWIGLGYEAVFGIISISILTWLYLKIFHVEK